jgi:hypothetical protein
MAITRIDRATDWLRHYLADHDGAAHAADIARAADAAGVNHSLIGLARAKVGVVIESRKTFPKTTVWRLPAA